MRSRRADDNAGASRLQGVLKVGGRVPTPVSAKGAAMWDFIVNYFLMADALVLLGVLVLLGIAAVKRSGVLFILAVLVAIGWAGVRVYLMF